MSCIPRTIDSLCFQGNYGSVFQLIIPPIPFPIYGMNLEDFTLYDDTDEFKMKEIRNNRDGTYFFEFHGNRKKIYIIFFESSKNAKMIIYQKKWFKKDKLISEKTYQMLSI